MDTVLNVMWAIVCICWYGVLAAIGIRLIMGIIFDK